MKIEDVRENFIEKPEKAENWRVTKSRTENNLATFEKSWEDRQFGEFMKVEENDFSWDNIVSLSVITTNFQLYTLLKEIHTALFSIFLLISLLR
jgi:hypothetical protein